MPTVRDFYDIHVVISSLFLLIIEKRIYFQMSKSKELINAILLNDGDFVKNKEDDFDVYYYRL